jgi:SAM-dependent methyltransferase
MGFIASTKALMRSVLKSFGPSRIKMRLWDEEFSSGKWDFIDDTRGDCVYPFIERYARNGSILDLGCGPGNTANELSTDAYGSYTGVDISEEALTKARRRSEECGRAARNLFALGDFLTYLPAQQFDVILFRESMYHVPVGKIKPMLDRYSGFLKDGGVFIVRMNASGGKLGRPKAMVDVMTNAFDVIEKGQFGDSGPIVMVFRSPVRMREA